MSDLQLNFKRLLPHLGALILFFSITAAYFYPQFEGKALSQHDAFEGAGVGKEIRDYQEVNDRQPLWTNSIYVGMPSFFAGLRFENYLRHIERVFQFYMGRPVGVFLGMMIVTYLSLIALGFSPFIAIIGAVSFGFATNNLILFSAGHMKKVMTLMYMPFVLSGAILLVRKTWIAGTLLLTLGIAMGLMHTHIQMTYYLFLCLLIVAVVYIVDFVRRKEFVDLGKILALVVLAAVLSLATNASRMWTTYDYSEETVRGKPIIESQTSDDASPGEESGYQWEKAMMWSNTSLDVLAGLIPRIVGGGSGERIGEGSTYNALKRARQPAGRDGRYQLPTYWGGLPFTEAPIYFGAIVLFLSALALFTVRGPLKWAFVIPIIFTILLSMGSNFSLLNRTLFDYFPLFSKFRAPNSVLSVTTLLFCVFAAIGLHGWFNWEAKPKEKRKALLIAALSTGGLAIAIAAIGSSFFSFRGAGDARLAESGILSYLVEDRKAMLWSDAIRSFLLVAAATALLWVQQWKKWRMEYAIAGLLVFIVIDFWGVNRRYIHPSDFQLSSGQTLEQYFRKRPIDQQIQQRHDSRGDYRVLDLSINTFNSNKASYYHNTIGGYTGVKLQRMQDMVDYHISRGNKQVLDMLNTTYIINQNVQLIPNQDANGWAWLVSTVRKVESPLEEIQALNDINTDTVAVVNTADFPNYVSGWNPSGEGSISRTAYELDRWEYAYDVPSEQLAVFSEVWYKPEKGLKAYVNGEPAEFIRVNYILRAIKLPAGSGKVEFRFEPQSYNIATPIQTTSSALLTLLAVGYFLFAVYREVRVTD